MSDLPLESEVSAVFPRKRIEVRPGVQLWISSGTLEHKLQRKASTTSSIFELAYSRKNPLYSKLGGASVEIKPGYSNLGFLGQTTGYSEYNCGEEIQLYSIWVEPQMFNDFCQAVSGNKNLEFHSFQNTACPYYSYKCDAQEECLLNKLGKSLEASGDRLNRLLLESQVLELLSMNIERLLCYGNKDGCPLSISAADMERLHEAREILLHRLDCPPTLLELSRLIQMNDFKMKRLFKQYYGKTIYQYVREERLEKAFSLLQDGQHNVSQTAFAVGYTNISHFSEAFHSYFGVFPHMLVNRTAPNSNNEL